MNQTLRAAAAALVFCTSVSGAQEAPDIPLTLAAGPGGTLSTSFEREVTGLFVDTFSFTPQRVDGTVRIDLAPTANDGPVNLFSALLNGQGFSYFPESGLTNFSFLANVTSDMPLTLTVLGFSGNADTLVAAPGAYRGTVTAVPEPASGLLMLAGLAAAGAWVRRRRGFT